MLSFATMLRQWTSHMLQYVMIRYGASCCNTLIYATMLHYDKLCSATGLWCVTLCYNMIDTVQPMNTVILLLKKKPSKWANLKHDAHHLNNLWVWRNILFMFYIQNFLSFLKLVFKMCFLWHKLSTFNQLLLLIDLNNLLESEQILIEAF